MREGRDTQTTNTLAAEWDPSKYADEYKDNLMDRLRESLDAVKQGKRAATAPARTSKARKTGGTRARSGAKKTRRAA